MYRTPLLVFVVLLLFSSSVFAQSTEPTPRTIPYNGTLELDGEALNGPHNFRVGLFLSGDAATACLGEEILADNCGLWQQEYTATTNAVFFVAIRPQEHLRTIKFKDTGHAHSYQTRIFFHDQHTSGNSYYSARDNLGGSIRNATTGSSAANLTDPTAPASGRPVRSGDETRPKNMSVVWIMRIK